MSIVNTGLLLNSTEYAVNYARERRETEKRHDAEKKRRLDKIRRHYGYTHGHPPDTRFEVPRCPPSYPIKVTRNLERENDYDGIIWAPGDIEYREMKTTAWCYQSIEEALSEEGYRFRRPKKRRKRKP